MQAEKNVQFISYVLLVSLFAYGIFIKGFSPWYFFLCFLLLGVAKQLTNK